MNVDDWIGVALLVVGIPTLVSAVFTSWREKRWVCVEYTISGREITARFRLASEVKDSYKLPKHAFPDVPKQS